MTSLLESFYGIIDEEISLFQTWGDPVGHIAREVLLDALDPLTSALSRSSSMFHSSLEAESLVHEFTNPDLLAPRDRKDSSVLWMALPCRQLFVVGTKSKHLLELIRRHHRDALWPLLSPFVRRAAGDLVAEIVVLCCLLHAGLILNNVKREMPDEALNPKAIVNQMMIDLSKNGDLAQNELSQLVYRVAAALKLHPGDYAKIVGDGGELLLSLQFEYDAAIGRARKYQQECVLRGESTNDLATHFLNTKLYAKLTELLDISEREVYRQFVDNCCAATTRSYSTVINRNEGLGPQHVSLLNSSFVECVVEILSTYQHTTQHVAKYRQLCEAREQGLSSQENLAKVCDGIALLRVQVEECEKAAFEGAAQCEALQSLCNSLHGVFWSHHSDDLNCDKTVLLFPAAKTKFACQLASSVDSFVHDLVTEAENLVSKLSAVEESCNFVIKATTGVLHEQSAALYPLAERVAKLLLESRVMTETIREESVHLVQPNSSESWWTELISNFAKPDNRSRDDTLLRRALMLLSSTVSTIRDAVCLLAPTFRFVVNTIDSNKQVLEHEQREAAELVVRLNMELTSLQVLSIKAEEEQTSPKTSSLPRRKDDVANARLLALEACRSLTSPFGPLDVQFVVSILSCMISEEELVSREVHSIVGSQRPLNEEATVRCFKIVACYNTVVELFSKSLF